MITHLEESLKYMLSGNNTIDTAVFKPMLLSWSFVILLISGTLYPLSLSKVIFALYQAPGLYSSNQ